MEFRYSPDASRFQLHVPFNRRCPEENVMSMLVRTLPLAFLLLSACNTGQSASHGTEIARRTGSSSSESDQLLFTKAAPGRKLIAEFHGQTIATGEATTAPVRMVDRLVIRDGVSGSTLVYRPETSTRQAADFFFTDVWSPDGHFLALPLDKNDGFAIFESASAITDVRANAPLDRIRVWNGAARKYWHSFVGWDGPHAIHFTAELDGSVKAFRYDLLTRMLTCIDAPCGTNDSAANLFGKVQLAGGVATR
jgi:hypothetical protein